MTDCQSLAVRQQYITEFIFQRKDDPIEKKARSISVNLFKVVRFKTISLFNIILAALKHDTRLISVQKGL